MSTYQGAKGRVRLLFAIEGRDGSNRGDDRYRGGHDSDRIQLTVDGWPNLKLAVHERVSLYLL